MRDPVAEGIADSRQVGPKPVVRNLRQANHTLTQITDKMVRVLVEESNVFVSQPVDGVIYVARRSLNGGAKFLRSAIEVASDQNDRRVDVEG